MSGESNGLRRLEARAILSARCRSSSALAAWGASSILRCNSSICWRSSSSCLASSLFLAEIGESLNRLRAIAEVVSCPRNSMAFAASQLVVFQGARDEHIKNRYVRSEQRGKTTDWVRPGGSRLKWTGGCVARGSLIDFRYAPLLAPCRRPILIATKAMLFRGQDTATCA